MDSLKVRLSALWAARMLSGLQGDSTRLHDPATLKDIIAGTSKVRVTKEMLLAMSLVFAVPILMSVLSLVLADKVSRWANRAAGTFFSIFDLVFLVLLAWPLSYETVWGVMDLVFTAMIAWYAWKWSRKDESEA